MNELWKLAIRNSLGTTLYVSAVGAFMFYGGEARIGRVSSFLIPITLLLLFVLSASVTSFLIFGKPAQLYIDGKKKEAITLLSYTLISFAAITVFSLILLLVMSNFSTPSIILNNNYQ